MTPTWPLPAAVDPAAVRLAHRVTEPIHAMIYFVPEARDRHAALGDEGTAGYFASRAAAMGPVGAGAVIGTFFNFHPRLIHRALPAVWDRVTPAAVLAARLDAADAALRRALGDTVDGPEVAEAAVLARRAAESVTGFAEGRALFAAHAGLPWPEPAHLQLWHAQTVLREFRGDGHVAALVTAGLTGVQALVLHTAAGEAEPLFLRRSRGWRAEQWARTVAELTTYGLIDGDPPVLTEAGKEVKDGIEAATDRLATPAYAVLGADGCARLAALTRPLSRTIVKAGLLDPANLLPPRA